MHGLGLICVDEEHDSSYKQESDPRYDARTVAAKRAALEGAVAVYGSATPRPESWHALERLELGVRLGAPMPSRADRRPPPRGRLSAVGAAAPELGGSVERGGKAILLLNRRGVAPALHCRACGRSRRCDLCDVALTLHRDERLHCHHCGYSEAVPETCPACGSLELARIGAGTQRLESELERQLPELERIRLDADTAAKPGALHEALERFAAGGPRRPDRHADGGEGPPLPRRRAGRGRGRGHGPRACRTFAPRSAPSSSSPSSPAAAAATRRAR